MKELRPTSTLATFIGKHSAEYGLSNSATLLADIDERHCCRPKAHAPSIVHIASKFDGDDLFERVTRIEERAKI
jgi:hypothetical protein